jgi:mRNA interferase RelE/StbE
MPGKPFRLTIKGSARKELLALPPKISGQVERTIERLLDAYRAGERPQDVRKLQGTPDIYRIDSGEYRILFTVDEDAAVISIRRVRHRRDVYRNL